METNATETNEQLTPEAEDTPVTINPEKLKQYTESLRNEQNLSFGAGAGLAAALIGAFLWALITVITKYQIGYMAVGVGLLVGYAVRFYGKGIDQVFGIMGAVLALFGCLLGNLFSTVGFVAHAESVSYFQILSVLSPTVIVAVFAETFSPMDLLFYGIAVYEGYKFSFRQITEQELLRHAV